MHWMGRGLNAEELNLARATSLRTGLRGIARRFAATLPIEVQKDFVKLSQEMNRQFPWVQVQQDRLAPIRKLASLKQGTRSFREYVDEAYRLRAEVPVEDGERLALSWVEGLNNQNVLMIMRSFIQDRGASHRFSLDEMVTKARSLLHEGIPEQPDQETDTEKITRALMRIADGFDKGARISVTSTPPTQRTARDRTMDQDRRDGAPTGSRQALPGPERNLICFRCGKEGHRSSACTQTPLPLEEQNRIRNAAWGRQNPTREQRMRDPPLSQTLGGERVTEIPTAAAALEPEDGPQGHYISYFSTDLPLSTETGQSDTYPPMNTVGIDEWGGATQSVYTVEMTDEMRAVRSQMDQLYAAGHKRMRGEDDPAPNESDRDRGAQPGPSMFRRKARPTDEDDQPHGLIQGLIGPRINVKDLVNQVKVTLSFAQLCDVSPYVRERVVESLQPWEAEHGGHSSKGKEPMVTVPINAVGGAMMPTRILQRVASTDVHLPVEEKKLKTENLDMRASRLFFAQAVILARCEDSKLRMSKLKSCLIDGGASANLISSKVVKTLGVSQIPVHNGAIEMADGSISHIHALVWVQVAVAGAHRVVMALVAPGDTNYHMILGRRWMQGVGMVGTYLDGRYSLINDDGIRTEVLRSRDVRPDMAQKKEMPKPIWTKVDPVEDPEEMNSAVKMRGSHTGRPQSCAVRTDEDEYLFKGMDFDTDEDGSNFIGTVSPISDETLSAESQEGMSGN
ncbi:hypothetical protein N7462_007847 [Penicillium macrosclerotiorum]|uniref:uncharacterized protein n=1 Tax=Penicillium macrosclerotiorum TaxID=303699 RepID=UPI0025472A23|nr:uncharacterized protein N7462_007847 [Penicillium macrosclerotiorum]KAJ5679603.1 hypothetical protein N7462_007847 [Penicillium macrosclerotiorum]